MHLTYDRIDGGGEGKEWPCGEVLIEIASALEGFAGLVLLDRLDKTTREKLSELRATLDPDEPDPGSRSIRQVSVATGLAAGQIRQVAGGTIHVRDIKSGGKP